MSHTTSARPAQGRRVAVPTLIALALAAAALLVALAARPSAAPAAASGDATSDVIVAFAPGTSLTEGRRLLAARGGRVTRDLHIINALAATLPADDAETLEDDVRVASVSPDAPTQRTGGISDATCSIPGATCSLRTSYPLSVNADWSWLDKKNRATGRGVTVAVIDSGIAGDHADFRTSSTDATSRVVADVVVAPETTHAGDRFGHGTHVAGIIAGNSKARPTSMGLRGAYQGVAPDAELVNVKVAGDDGATSVADVIAGLQFVVDNKDAYGIRVVNLSLTSTVAESYRTDPLAAAVEQAWFKGLVVVAAAGNAGTAPDAVSYAPANDPYIITVGAVDDRQTHTSDDDVLASWSSRGRTQDGFAKPEIVAPGARIVAPLAPGSDYADQCPTCVTDGDYIQLGGTSMAAPVVAGVAALLLENHPEWTPDQVKSAIVAEARETKDDQLEPDVEDATKLDDRDRELSHANRGLVPNELVSPTTGELDFQRMSFRRMSFRRMSFRADGASVWGCDCLPAPLDATEGDLTRMSFRVSWSTSFTK